MPVYHYLPLFLLLTVGIIISVKAEKLTLPAALTGGAIAVLIFLGAGYTGLSLLAAFFVLGTIATVWKKKEKQQFKPATDHTKRNTGQVLANGGVAAIIGIMICFMPAQTELLIIMMAASLASAVADTLSSELGVIYGHRFYNIVTFKRDKRGLDGVISLEGTLIGVAGSVIIAIIYTLDFGWNNSFLVILVAGTIGNLSDSVLGALLERRHYLDNDDVNFLNTLIAALAAGLYVVLR